MFKDLPVQLEGYKVRVAEVPEPKTYKNDKGEVVTATNRDGVVLYTMPVTFRMKHPVAEGKKIPKGFEVAVTLETAPGEEIEDGALVELVNPRISQWASDFGQGVSMRAMGVKVAG